MLKFDITVIIKPKAELDHVISKPLRHLSSLFVEKSLRKS